MTTTTIKPLWHEVDWDKFEHYFSININKQSQCNVVGLFSEVGRVVIVDEKDRVFEHETSDYEMLTIFTMRNYEYNKDFKNFIRNNPAYSKKTFFLDFTEDVATYAFANEINKGMFLGGNLRLNHDFFCKNDSIYLKDVRNVGMVEGSTLKKNAYTVIRQDDNGNLLVFQYESPGYKFNYKGEWIYPKNIRSYLFFEKRR